MVTKRVVTGDRVGEDMGEGDMQTCPVLLQLAAFRLARGGRRGRSAEYGERAPAPSRPHGTRGARGCGRHTRANLHIFAPRFNRQGCNKVELPVTGRTRAITGASKALKRIVLRPIWL
ncbi:MAG: hypothetical protein Kow0058_13330 [Roseovarius sp.]